MVTRLNSDLLAGIFFIITGMGTGYIASDYAYGSSGQMGPGYLPFWLSALMVIFGIAISWRGLRATHQQVIVFGLPLVLIICATVAAFGPLLEHLGMIVAVPTLVVVSRLVGGHRNGKEILIISVALTAFCALVFVWALNGAINLWPK